MSSNRGGYSFTVYNCSQNPNWNDGGVFCPCIITVAVASIITLLVGIISGIRILYISKRKINFFTLIHLAVFFYNLCHVLYLIAVDIFWVYYLGEIIKITINYAFVCYYALSIIRFKVGPIWLTQRMAIVGFLLCYFPVFTAFVLTVARHSSFGCQDPARLTLHAFQILVAILFFVVGYIVFFKAESRTTMSQGYLLKYTKPMQIVILFFALNATVNFSTYLYSFLLANDAKPQYSCSKIMSMFFSPNMIIFYELSVSAYEILPIWGIYWYYYATTHKHSKNKLDRYGDHRITTVDEDEYYEGKKLIILAIFSHENNDVIFNDLLDAHQSGNNDGMNINLSHGISIGKYNSYLSQDEEQGISLDASLLLTQSDYH